MSWVVEMKKRSRGREEGSSDWAHASNQPHQQLRRNRQSSEEGKEVEWSGQQQQQQQRTYIPRQPIRRDTAAQHITLTHSLTLSVSHHIQHSTASSSHTTTASS